LPVITFWLMGSFSNSTIRSLYTGVPMIVLGMVVLYLMRYRMNALSLKEEEAASLGINVRQNRMIVIVASSLITASVVSMCGVVGWVGLLIPHISRMLFGNNHTKVIPGCIVFGALFMLIIDTIARCMYQAEIPVSILTAIIGAPVFLLLLRKTGGIEI
jgi:iron complex transport system permease protein